MAKEREKCGMNSGEIHLEQAIDCNGGLSKINSGEGFNLEETNSCSHECSQELRRDINTPSCKRPSLFDFRCGIIFSSTPEPVFSKKFKRTSNLSPIKEDDTNNSGDLSNIGNTLIQEKKTDSAGLLDNSLKRKSFLLHNEEKHCLCSIIKENSFSTETAKNIDIIKTGDGDINSSEYKPLDIDIKNLSAIKKDELSLYFEKSKNLVQFEEDLHEFNSSKHENLTLRTKNNETIVYQASEDKIIDEVILNEKLPYSDADKEPEFKEILNKANNLKIFVSNNEEENKDNFNSDWKKMEKFDTDEERYKAVRQNWKNQTVPNPKQNLSVFNWKWRNRKNAVFNFNSKDIKKVNTEASDINNRYGCEDVIGAQIMQLKYSYAEKYRQLELLYQGRERNSYNKTSVMDDQLIANCQYQLASLKEKIERHDMAKMELMAVNSFYNGLHSRNEDITKLTTDQLREVEEIDRIIHMYSILYDNRK